nr:hypothetical protein [Tanacetum cinerariifolium]
MRTRSSSNLFGETSTNPNPKGRNHRRSKQRVEPFSLEKTPVVTMADQRTMVELLRAPTEGYAEAIVVPPIPAEHFGLKHTSVKAVEESCVTCGGAHSYRQCPVTNGNTFLGYQDNIQGYVSAAAMNYNQGNTVYRPQKKFKKTNEASMQAMRNHISNLKSELRSEMQSTMQNQNNAFKNKLTNDIKNIMASFFQMNTASTLGSAPLPSNIIANPKGESKSITTRSGIVLDGPFVPMSHPFTNPEEDERAKETLTDPDLTEYTIKVPHPLVQKPQAPLQKSYEMPKRDPLHPNIPYPLRMYKEKQQDKDEI